MRTRAPQVCVRFGTWRAQSIRRSSPRPEAQAKPCDWSACIAVPTGMPSCTVACMVSSKPLPGDVAQAATKAAAARAASVGIRDEGWFISSLLGGDVGAVAGDLLTVAADVVAHHDAARGPARAADQGLHATIGMAREAHGLGAVHGPRL